MDPIELFRSEFSRADTSSRATFLNNAGTSLLPRVSRDTIKLWSDRFYNEGIFAVPDAYRDCERARTSLAKLLGSEAKQISFYSTTAAAISQVAFAFPFNSGDEILIWDQEYPSNFYAWREAAKRANAKLVVVPSGPHLETPVSTLKAYVTDRTRLIAFSWVQYRTGASLDLQELTQLTRHRGIFTCADIIQGAGVRPFEFSSSGLDAACGGSHKWLCSVPSIGYLILKDEWIERLNPIYLGAASFGTSEDRPGQFEHPKSDSHRFEPGSLPLLEVLSLGASVDLIERTGIDIVSQTALQLANALREGLSHLGYKLHNPAKAASEFEGSIINFGPGERSSLTSLNEITKKLTDERIAFSLRTPGIRLSPHAWNTSDDIGRVLDVLK